MRDEMKGIFGTEVIDSAGECLGMDDEGELLGHYRPSGHPGVRIIMFCHRVCRLLTLLFLS